MLGTLKVAFVEHHQKQKGVMKAKWITILALAIPLFLFLFHFTAKLNGMWALSTIWHCP